MKYYSIQASPIDALAAQSIVGSAGATIFRIDNDGKSSTVFFEAAGAEQAAAVAKGLPGGNSAKEISLKEATTLR